MDDMTNESFEELIGGSFDELAGGTYGETTGDPYGEPADISYDDTNMDDSTDTPAEDPAESPMQTFDEAPRPVNPRRKKKSQLQIFKEAYLPIVIAGLALFLIIVFIIGSASRAIRKNKVEKDASIAASSSLAAQQDALNAEVQRLLDTAAAQAAGYDYVGAVATIDSFSGDIAAFQELMTKRAEYVEAQRNLTEINDPNEVLNLSFQMLVADPARAYADESYSDSYANNFVTIGEFSKILQQLYDNGYMLVSMDDFITTITNADGTTSYAAKTMYLPAGKKPLMITQTQVNYYTYMTDGDGDGLPDKDGAGFASKLIVGSDGKITNEYVDASGNTVTGAYDLVPILDAFIESHPDFSFGGAKATLALTGSDGVFGYRTNPGAKEALGEEAYNAELQGAASIINALRADGYTFACYTYDNMPYGDMSADAILEDLNYWNNEVVPLLGSTNILVYAVNSDIAEPGPYSGEIYETLNNQGFRFYLGFCDEGDTWVTAGADYVRQGRILVTGYNLLYNADWFTGMFDAATVLESGRPE